MPHPFHKQKAVTPPPQVPLPLYPRAPNHSATTTIRSAKHKGRAWVCGRRGRGMGICLSRSGCALSQHLPDWRFWGGRGKLAGECAPVCICGTCCTCLYIIYIVYLARAYFILYILYIWHVLHMFVYYICLCMWHVLHMCGVAPSNTHLAGAVRGRGAART